MAKKLELAKSDAEAKDKAAAAGLKQAQTQKTIVETQLLPQKAAHDQAMDHTKMAHTAITDIQDRADDQQTQQMDMMRDHADRHQAAVFRGADMHDAEQARQFQGQQSEADRAAQQAAMQARMAQPQAAPA
jgi:hypothetical protein